MSEEVSKSEQTSKAEGDSPARAGETAQLTRPQLLYHSLC